MLYVFLISVMFPKFGKMLDILNIQSFNLDYFMKFTQHLIEKHKEMLGV